MPRELPLAVGDAELPANTMAAASMQAEGAGPMPTVHLDCTDSSLTLRKLSVRPGEQSDAARLRQVGSGGLLHLSFTPGVIGLPPCVVAARIETGNGVSEARPLGRVVRLPTIEKFTLTNELVAAGVYSGWIEGEELESIDKTGWNGQAQ